MLGSNNFGVRQVRAPLRRSRWSQWPEWIEGWGMVGGVYQMGWGTYKRAFTLSKATVLFLHCQFPVAKSIIVSEMFLPHPCHSISGNFFWLQNSFRILRGAPLLFWGASRNRPTFVEWKPGLWLGLLSQLPGLPWSSPCTTSMPPN